MNCTEASEDRCSARRIGQDGRKCILGCAIIIDLEITVCSGATSMNNALRDALVVETMDFLATDVILKKRRPRSAAVGGFEPVS